MQNLLIYGAGVESNGHTLFLSNIEVGHKDFLLVAGYIQFLVKRVKSLCSAHTHTDRTVPQPT